MSDNRVAELWGCGFNQFDQIDNSGRDVFELKKIDQSHPSPSPQLSILWAGWADLIYSRNIVENGEPKSQLIFREYRVTGPLYRTVTYKEETNIGHDRFVYGIETWLDVYGCSCFTSAIEKLPPIPEPPGMDASDQSDTHTNDNPKTKSISKDFRSLAIAGNAHVAKLSEDGTTVRVYSSFAALQPEKAGDTTDPVFTLKITKPTSSPATSTISSLSAGDAHFSFIVSYVWPSTSPTEEAYYNNVWSIRTDSRSIDDSGWVPLQEELSTLEDSSFVHIESSASSTSEIHVLCAHNTAPVEFIKCVSAGWITAALCYQGRAWIFPFGRAIATIPQIPIGEVSEFSGVMDISVGSSHIAILKGDAGETQVWTFGLNDHGQRGFKEDESQELDEVVAWQKLMIQGNGIIKQVVCGKWNTFIVIERTEN